jgi:hypothetical protein
MAACILEPATGRIGAGIDNITATWGCDLSVGQRKVPTVRVWSDRLIERMGRRVGAVDHSMIERQPEIADGAG